MAAREFLPVTFLTFLCAVTVNFAQVLTPPYFNLAKGRTVEATATCGENIAEPELFCRLTGATGDRDPFSDSFRELIQGQLCDHCDMSVAEQSHPAEYAIDGTERWWQSPPLSRGSEYNQVNVTVNLGQEYHVAYVFLKMANSPRPGVWALERSTDFGQTWKAWQYFADTPSDCQNFFNSPHNLEINSDDDVLCTTDFSKIVPLENGEIVVSLVNGRPSAYNFSYATTLQSWTKATNVRLRLMRTKTLLGHLMAVARQDPTVTRRYYYSIKDISIGGRCVCNGYAELCDRVDQDHPGKLLCVCQHNTCGPQCERCCPGFVQKQWQPARLDDPFQCEPCECYGHSDECIYDEAVDMERRSIDIHGKYEGGGVCQNCRHNTMGINCDQCVAGFYRPAGYPLDAIDVCHPCDCDPHFSNGECDPGTGRCHCRPEFIGENCDECSLGYYGWPNCVPCDCDINGTENSLCTVGGGQCPCKHNYVGRKCDMCAFGFYNFSYCVPCECGPVGSVRNTCDVDSGQCECQVNFGGRQCTECANGYFEYPICKLCNCDPQGTEEEICDKDTAFCFCKSNFASERCDRCAPEYHNYPYCQECNCHDVGSLSTVCHENGQCQCRPNYAGLGCDRCAPGYYKFPDCISCECNLYGSIGRTCDQLTGQCDCRHNFKGLKCGVCKDGLYNYPMCEECNCNPAGAKEVPGHPLGGCGIVTRGQLCECKDHVMGRICDVCKPGYWNLNRNNPYGCEGCRCHMPGTIAAINVCSRLDGQCMCKVDVTGQNCDMCQDGYYFLSEDNPFGCIDCMCDMGGSVSSTCNKRTGDCVCKPRVTGRKCDQPIGTHFFPSLHQYRFEIEDGYTTEGTRVRYDYDQRIFPGYSWRGYAILSSIQPEVLMDVEIFKPSLYRVIYRYINRNQNTVEGEVTLTPESSHDQKQTSSVLFSPSEEPEFATVGSSGGVSSTLVLNPGKWTVSIKTPESVFLDYFILVPQSYYEATVLQENVRRPCTVPGDDGPCIHYNYPDISGYPTADGGSGYIVIDGENIRSQVFDNQEILDELGPNTMAYLNENQTSLQLDLSVPDPGMYVMVLNYFQDGDKAFDVSVDVRQHDQTQQGTIFLYKCQYSSLCRQVVKSLDGDVAVFNISDSTAYVTLTGDDDIKVAIDSIVAIPRERWSVGYIRPSIVCIKLNGVCVGSRHSTPSSSVRVDYESGANEHLRATDLPPGLLDPAVGLVKLNLTLPSVTVDGTVRNPGQYVFLVHFYLPNEAGSNIDVQLKNDGQIHTGVFRPRYCPSVSGCRELIYFGDAENEAITLRDTNVRLQFNDTSGQDIWMDYALLIPAVQLTPNDLELQPVDKSASFISQCVTPGFEISQPVSRFCQHGIFTLTTDFNNGALACDCNPDGSLSFQCDSYGGQCQCRPNVIGRACSACKPGHYDFPRCKPCNCPFGLCQEFTGECICPPRVTGAKCDQCQPATYGYDALIGCEECLCDLQGVVDRDANCDQTTGQCSCMSTVGGRRCDVCLPGHYAFPQCYPCECDSDGTEEDICDMNTGTCLCKKNVGGSRCDTCLSEKYSLDPRNPNGCTSCFCFGTTTRCDSSFSLTWEQVTDMTGWGITNAVQGSLREGGSVVALLEAADKILDTTEAMYWTAPSSYLGNKITTYGGKLQYSVVFTMPREDAGESYGLIKPDVILYGNNMTLAHDSTIQPPPGQLYDMEVDILEYKFKHMASGDSVSREQLMMVLVNLSGLHIRASYYTIVGEVRLKDVMLDMGSTSGPGLTALSVERCQCPPNYQGTSCEECAQGYYRSRTSPYLGICVPCECNGHSDTCDPLTGQCLNCRDNTTGVHCEQCFTGYYGDPYYGACQICSCPLPLPSNSFAGSCQVIDGFVSLCDCDVGYTGSRCERCDAGYYGNPNEIGSSCQSCECSGNIDPNNPESCDFLSGACLICLGGTAGAHCEICQDWWYGDAVTEKNCQPCSCDRCGSDVCDGARGACECKPNVMGLNCDQCAPNTYGFESCEGCRKCNCGPGSVSDQCHLQTGECQCQPGVLGHTCDRCMDGYWNYSPAGCQVCQCFGDGAITCDRVTGRCVCLPGVTGPNCDRCLPRWILIPNQGCRECDNCVHILLDDMDFLDENITIVQRNLQSVSVGVAAFKRINYINETLKALQPDVTSLYIDTGNFTLTPLRKELDFLASMATELDEKAQTTLSSSEAANSDADLFVETSSEVEREATNSENDASDAVRHVKEVVQRILTGIQVTNIEEFSILSEQILEEIGMHNFSDGENNVNVELAEARAELDKVKAIGRRAGVLYNQTLTVHEIVNNISLQLYDLQKNTRESQTDSDEALDIVARLRNLKTDVIQALLDSVDMAQEDSEDLMAMSNHLLQEARLALKTSRDAFIVIETDSSRMDGAMDRLEEFVNKLASELEGIDPIVNNSFVHAGELTEQAADLEGMYGDTRDIAANALKAANAYQNIIDAIIDAYNASKQALSASMSALDKSSGVGESSKESKQESIRLLLASQQRYNTTQIDLSARLIEAIDSTNEVESLIDRSHTLLAMVINSLTALDKGEAGQRARQAMDKAENAGQQALASQEKIGYILQQLPEDKKKAQDISQEITDASWAITKSEGQVDNVKGMVPDIKRLLIDLVGQQESATGVGSGVVSNISQLRRRIELARDEANRIRVGLKFKGNTTLTLRNPSSQEIEEAGSYSKVSLYFKTRQADAMLMYVGGDVASSRPTTDYQALEMINGQVVFKFDLGSGPARIVHPWTVDDNQWYQVEAKRIGKTGYLTVRRKPELDDPGTLLVSGNSSGTFTVLELRPQTTRFYLGGAPQAAHLPVDVRTIYFEGVMEDVKFDETPLGLWNFVNGESNDAGALERDILTSAVSSNGFRFSGDGYVILSARDMKLFPGKEFNVNLKLKTFAENGLILFMHKARDFLSLEIRDGKILFQYDLGSKPAVLMSANTYNDGEWHSIQAGRVGKDGLLKVGEDDVDKGESPGSLSELSITDDIFIGGYNDLLLPTRHATSTGFDGCIQDVQFDSSWDLDNNKQAKGVIPGCPEQVARVVSFSADKAGFISMPLESIGSNFDVTFKMKTHEDSSLLLYTSNTEQSSAFSVSVIEGEIVVKCDPGDAMTTLVSKINTYNDGRWHYISIMKMGKKITMNIDDNEIVDTTIEGPADLETERHLFFGGTNFEIIPEKSGSTVPLIGCIGDVTVNGRFLNFASISPRYRKNIHLASCPIPDPDFTMMTTVAPDGVTRPDKAEPEGPELEPGRCALPKTQTPVEAGEDTISGTRYGAYANSRVEYEKVPGSFRIRSVFSVEFKTQAKNGVIFYVADKRHVDFIALSISNGQVVYAFNCGSGAAYIPSPDIYNDGNWHTVRFSRRQREGTLEIDGNKVADGTSVGTTRSINVKPPYFIGGLSKEYADNKALKKNVQDVTQGFMGCIRNFMLNKADFGPPLREYDVQQCSSAMEPGTFFYTDGGHVVLYDKYKVGLDLDIMLQIKPRTLSGVILAVHASPASTSPARADFLTLQMADGEVIFTADNGAGPISARFVPSVNNELCNGQWHSIRATKNKNVVTLIVDGTKVDPGIGQAGVSQTDTNNPLYIGGVPEGTTRGIEAKENYVGCIRNLQLNGRMQYITSGTTVGAVELAACPVH